MDWRREFDSELARGEEARRKGNEGRARVCARRAAGIAIREYISRRHHLASGKSTLDLFSQLYAEPGLSAELRDLVDHLTVRVDEQFRLPPHVDLLADAVHLRDRLFPHADSSPKPGT